jgi:glycerol-3-phosphate dehydrogenase (NAD(P)+)
VTGTVTILGAGAMGSALATPFRAAGWEVRLWGTWLDDHLLEACAAGRPHPRTGVPLAPGTVLFESGRLGAALDGADASVLAVASVGVIAVARLALAGLAGTRMLLLTSKGFSPGGDGQVLLLPEALRRLAEAEGAGLPPIVAVGGPCKANEVAAARWTATIFGCRERAVAEEAARTLGTEAYRADATDDELGVEISAPMKNVYAIALGLADGLEEREGEPHHDLKAAAFAQSVRELIVLTGLVGGRVETAIGLAGVGDLEVTGLSGRNKVYGARIGRGETPSAALEAMAAAEQTVEGVPAARLAKDLVDQRDPAAWPSLPLLTALLAIVEDDPDPVGRVVEAVLPGAA